MYKAKITSTLIFSLITTLSFSQIISLDNVSYHVGDTITVCGKVFDATYLHNSKTKPTLINIGDVFPKQKLTVVIYGQDRPTFSYKPEDFLLSKNICVKGKVGMFQGRPQIVVSGPFQIRVQN